MMAIHSLKAIEADLPGAFLKRYPACGNVRMVGILFAHPDSPLAKSEIVPRLKYFHQLSDNHITFYCAGYGTEGEDLENAKEVANINENIWQFSDRAFIKTYKEFEKRTGLKYSGGVDLVLANAQFNPGKKTAQLDFLSTIFLQLDGMKADGAILSIEQFFMRIITYSSSAKNNDPTWGFSHEQIKRASGSALKRVILSFLPKGLAKDYNKLEHFAIKVTAQTA